MTEHELDERAAENLLTFLREQEQATGVLPSDRAVVVERFRDEIGDWRLCILTPFGARVHAPWALALAARLRESLGLEVNFIWSDDGVALHLPDADAPPPLDELLVGPDELDDLVVAELGGTRALRRPLPRERRPRAPDPAPPSGPAHAALAAAAEGAGTAPGRPPLSRLPCRAGDLPRGAPGRLRPARAARAPRRAPAAPHRPRRGRDAERVALCRLAPLRLRRHVHVRGRHAARRAAGAGARPRSRPPEGAARPGGAPRPHRPRRARAGGGRATRLAGRAPTRSTTFCCGAATSLPASSTRRWPAQLEAERRAVRVRVAGAERLIAAEDAGRYRDALGRDAAVRPPRCLSRRRGGSAGLDPPALRARARAVHHRRSRRAASASSPSEWRRCSRRSTSSAASCAPADPSASGATRTSSGASAVPAWPGSARRWSRSSQGALGRFLPGWQGVDRRATLREALVPLQGLSLPVALWESDVLPAPRARLPAGLARPADRLGRGRLGGCRARAGRPLLPRGRPRARVGPARCRRRRTRRTTRSVPALAGGALFWFDLLAATGLDGEAALPALWDLVWAGEVTNDAWQPLRASRRFQAPRGRRSGRGASRAPARTRSRRRRAAGPRPAGLFAGEPDPARSPSSCSSATGSSPATAFGPRASRAAMRPSIGSSGSWRRWASAGAATSSRASAARSSPSRARWSALRERPEEETALVLAAADPAQPYGAALPWPKRSGARAARVAGAYVVLLGGEPALFVERGGRSLVPLRDPEEGWLRSRARRARRSTRAARA